MLMSKKLEIRKKKMKSVKEPIKSKQSALKLIEPNPSKDTAMHEGDNPSFCNESIKFTLFLTVQGSKNP
jgi:virulence-associated protein VagC